MHSNTENKSNAPQHTAVSIWYIDTVMERHVAIQIVESTMKRGIMEELWKQTHKHRKEKNAREKTESNDSWASKPSHSQAKSCALLLPK